MNFIPSTNKSFCVTSFSTAILLISLRISGSSLNNALNPQLLEEYEYDTTLPLSQQFDLNSDDLEEDPSYIIRPISDLLIQLETIHKSLILDLVSMNKNILNNHNPRPTEKDKIKTIQLLSKDKIFMNELKKIKTDIENSYNKLLNVQVNL